MVVDIAGHESGHAVVDVVVVVPLQLSSVRMTVVLLVGLVRDLVSVEVAVSTEVALIGSLMSRQGISLSSSPEATEVVVQTLFVSVVYFLIKVVVLGGGGTTLLGFKVVVVDVTVVVVVVTVVMVAVVTVVTVFVGLDRPHAHQHGLGISGHLLLAAQVLSTQSQTRPVGHGWHVMRSSWQTKNRFFSSL